MKWKLTLRYLISVLSIVFIVAFVNLFVLIGLLYFQQTNVSDSLSTETGETFTRQFSKYLSMENDEPTILKEGVQALDEFGGWVQILDTNGNVLAEALSPDDAPKHYSPIQLVHNYKYMDENLTTYYIGEFEDYSYLIGVVDSPEERFVIMFNIKTFLSYASKAFIGMTIADLLVAMLIGLVFSVIITKPVTYIINRISQLKERNFTVHKMKRQGVFKQVFSNLDDVSETLQAHEEERIKLEKMREEWISNVSHDLKTPLASIQGFAELLQEQEVSNAERKDHAAIIEQKSIYMSELLDDFNLTMRLRNQEMPLNRKSIRLEKFVRELVIELLNDPQNNQRTIHFVSNEPDLVWAIDQHLMKRAILNFIHNAMDHNDKNVEITVKVTAESMVIEDDGKGIKQEDIEQIFNRYYRGSNTESIKGTGLGLAIAKDIIEAHGGRVELTSEVGKGTRIEIYYK